MKKFKVKMFCGAYFMAKDDPRVDAAFSTDKWGIRIGVFDTETSCDVPKFDDGKRAWCFMSCPCRRKAHRKEDRCFSEKTGRPDRHVVTCHIESVEEVVEVNK